MPGTFDSRQSSINRKRTIAQALMQQGMEPLAMPQQPGVPISGWQGAAKLAQALFGALGNRKLDKQQSALSDEMQADRSSKALSLADVLMPQSQGETADVPSPAIPGYSQSFQLPPTIMQNDARTASVKSLAQALASQDPMIQKLAMSQVESLYQSSSREDQQKAAMALQQSQQKAEGIRAENTQYGENTRQAEQLGAAAKQNEITRGVTISENEKNRQLQRDLASAKIPPMKNPGFRDVEDKGQVTREYFDQSDPSTVTFSKVIGPVKSQAGGSGDDVVIQYSEDGVNKQGLLNKSTREIKEIKTPGGSTAGAKYAEPPAAVKTQGMAAMTSLKQVDNIQKIIQQHPDLIGPFAGRAQEFFQGVGSNPFVGTINENLGAQLAEHLNALFAQELRSMFPGRTNAQMQDIIKSTSARMKQDPNMMMGFLEGIRKNEGMVLDAAKQQGFVEDRGATPAPADGGITLDDIAKEKARRAAAKK